MNNIAYQSCAGMTLTWGAIHALLAFQQPSNKHHDQKSIDLAIRVHAISSVALLLTSALLFAQSEG